MANDLNRLEAERLHRRSVCIGWACFSLDASLYLAAVVWTMLVPNEGLRLLGSVAISVMIGRLLILAHDACHQALTPSRRSNALIGRMAFLPALHAYSLWDLHHNRTHHRYTNQLGRDHDWVPLTPAAYAQLSSWQQIQYRYYRTVIGHLFYYLVEVWWSRMWWPRPSLLKEWRSVYVFDSALVIFWTITALTGMTFLQSSVRGIESMSDSLAWAQAAFYGIGLPFLLFSFGISFLTFLHHNHPATKWYDPESKPDWRAFQISGSAHAIMPWPLAGLLHRIMDHTAHHVRPSIPHYHLAEAQQLYEDKNPDQVVSYHWTPAVHYRLLKLCKLYDPHRHCWVDFAGNPALSAQEIGELQPPILESAYD